MFEGYLIKVKIKTAIAPLLTDLYLLKWTGVGKKLIEKAGRFRPTLRICRTVDSDQLRE